jgi:hypothetical protein
VQIKLKEVGVVAIMTSRLKPAPEAISGLFLVCGRKQEEHLQKSTDVGL